ncbi:MAG: cyclic di-GMP phosphodiesterase [Janthinobacterium lividum]
MNDELDIDLLETYFGTASPYWRLLHDSNALELAAVRGPARLSCGLTPAQAAIIRAFNGVTAHAVLEVDLFGDRLKLHLVGKKMNAGEWAGTASSYYDTGAVARDLVNGLSFAEQIVSEVNSLVAVIDRNGLIQRFNRKCEEFSGLREEDVIGRSGFELFMSTDQASASSGNIQDFFETGRSYEAERYLNTVQGRRLFLFRNKFVRSGSGIDQQFLICSGTDITEERNAQLRLRELANTDSLTGLLNRNALHEKVTQALAAAGDAKLGILFLDLDNFKKVNDHYGHVLGDRLLQDVAFAIKSCLAPDDTLARLGGDEFIVLLGAGSTEQVDAVAQRILDRLREPFALGLMSVYTGCSIGLAVYPEHGNDVETLIRNADTAMYAAKDAGKKVYRIFSQDMNDKVSNYVWLDTNLRKALEENQLELHYQPVISQATGQIRSLEALLRWNSPERGRIPPLDFIGFAEESGLIGALGQWVMRAAATQAVKMQAQGLDLRISVNVSVRQLCDTDVVQHFADAMASAGMEHCMLDVELTESCFIEDETTAIAVIKEFRALGAQIYLDDFGTGYSSLSQLTRIPLDAIKLDRSFITSIDTNVKAQALVRSMVVVAGEFGFAVVAEGVETQAEAAFLKAVGVEYLQGFLYSRPMPADTVVEWVGQQGKLRLIA